MKPSSFSLRRGSAVPSGGIGKRLGLFACLLALGCFWTSGNLHADTLPDSVSVLPVFFVPQGEAASTEAQKTKLMQHLSWARQRYFEMLKFRDTFALATTTPLVYNSSQPLSYYQQDLDQGGGASQDVCELLNHLGYTRTNCPYIFFVVVMNPASTAGVFRCAANTPKISPSNWLIIQDNPPIAVNHLRRTQYPADARFSFPPRPCRDRLCRPLARLAGDR